MGRLIVLVIPLLGACRAMSAFAPAAEVEVYDLRRQTFSGVEGAPDTSDKNRAPDLPESEPRQADRQVIYNGAMALQVADVDEAEDEVAAIAKGMGGWLQKIERPRVTVRVPAAKFEETMTALGELGQVVDKKVEASDVTDQFLDLKLRLKNAEKVRARFAALLDQAKTVVEALAVEKELARVTEEIERLKGQLALMRDRIAHSTITVSFQRALPYRVRMVRFPFRWVHRLGAEALFNF